ncbi:hypothetical protein HDE79_004393 [Rhodanobacter sp. MP1X3]|nr:hypothetical protein [Rhodanobacter sp. MP1X3]
MSRDPDLSFLKYLPAPAKRFPNKTCDLAFANARDSPVLWNRQTSLRNRGRNSVQLRRLALCNLAEFAQPPPM